MGPRVHAAEPDTQAEDVYTRGPYKYRNVIERLFSRIRRCCRVATWHQNHAAIFAGFVHLQVFVTAENEFPRYLSPAQSADRALMSLFRYQ